jgi:hypothetical protein
MALTASGCDFGGTVVAVDHFNADVRNGWGTTEPGGTYTVLSEPADYDVVDGVGTILLRKTATPRAVLLNHPPVLDYRAQVRISVDKLPVGGRAFTYLSIRRTDRAEYLAKLSFAEGGAAFLEAAVLRHGAVDIETSLAGEIKLADSLQSPRQWFTLDVEIEGTNPTTVRLRAWGDGGRPVDWLLSVEDASPELQTAGITGVRAALGGGVQHTPYVTLIDDLRVTADSDVFPSPSHSEPLGL